MIKRPNFTNNPEIGGRIIKEEHIRSLERVFNPESLNIFYTSQIHMPDLQFAWLCACAIISEEPTAIIFTHWNDSLSWKTPEKRASFKQPPKIGKPLITVSGVDYIVEESVPIHKYSTPYLEERTGVPYADILLKELSHDQQIPLRISLNDHLQRVYERARDAGLNINFKVVDISDIIGEEFLTPSYYYALFFKVLRHSRNAFWLEDPGVFELIEGKYAKQDIKYYLALHKALEMVYGEAATIEPPSWLFVPPWDLQENPPPELYTVCIGLAGAMEIVGPRKVWNFISDYYNEVGINKSRGLRAALVEEFLRREEIDLPPMFTEEELYTIRIPLGLRFLGPRKQIPPLLKIILEKAQKENKSTIVTLTGEELQSVGLDYPKYVYTKIPVLTANDFVRLEQSLAHGMFYVAQDGKIKINPDNLSKFEEIILSHHYSQ